MYDAVHYRVQQPHVKSGKSKVMQCTHDTESKAYMYESVYAM